MENFSNTYGLESQYLNLSAKHFYDSLVGTEDWVDNFKSANAEFAGCNGANFLVRTHTAINTTNGVQELCEQNQCFWFVDFILSIVQFHPIPKDFQVWRLFCLDNKNYIICEDGDYNVLMAHELPFTDFADYGHNFCTFYLIQDLILLPQEY